MSNSDATMVDHFEGFVPIHTIFYAVFHPTEGTKVRNEFPPGNLESNNINFDTIKNYVIPKPQLCHKLLTLKYKNYRLVSYPVTINSSFYARNFFSFNFVFVFPYDCETSPYEPAIARLGKMFRVLEEQNQILSKAERDPVYFDFKSAETTADQDNKLNSEKGTKNLAQNQGLALEKYYQILTDIENNESNFSVKDLVMRIYQDLNNYSECLIPIDAGNAVDIKIFPLMTPPNSRISIEDVPTSTVNLNKVIDVNWDPTMLKIVPYIDGLNSIAKIAKLSDSDPDLVVECIKHLIYYNCVLLSDIFQFSNIYAPASLLRMFLTDTTLSSECQLYVVIAESSKLPSFVFERGIKEAESIHQDLPTSRRKRRESDSRTTSMSSSSEVSSHKQQPFSPSSSGNILYKTGKQHEGSISSYNSNGSRQTAKHLPTKSCLFDLYRSLSQGTTLREWYRMNFNIIRANNIDVRRFITFGIINGLIYRCYSFPVMKNLEVFDFAKRLNAEGDVPPAAYNKRINKAQTFSKNIFSTSDIKFGTEDSGKGSNKKHPVLNLDIGDEVLRNVYKKISSTYHCESRSTLANPMSRLYQNESQGSLSDSSTTNIYHPKRSERQSKVSFDMNQEGVIRAKPFTASQRAQTKDDEMIRSLERKRETELLLLESVEAAESFDQICVKLEKPRQEVEELLKELGDYKIINS